MNIYEPGDFVYADAPYDIDYVKTDEYVDILCHFDPPDGFVIEKRIKFTKE